jgi:hypothetical protein
MLAQQADRRLRDGQRVGRVDAELGKGGRMGLFAGAMDVEHRGSDDLGAQHVERCGMDHHRRMDAPKGAALEQQNLAARVSDLLGGRADHADGQPDVIRDPCCGDGCPDRRGGNDVMAAGVANAGQTVVFRADTDMQRPGSRARPEGGRKVTDAPLHCEAGVG